MVARANRNQRLGGRSWVYFAQAGDGGPVKIGQTRQVGPRINALQNAHYEPIKLLGIVPETLITERHLLSYFGQHRIRGEWFHPVPELLAIASAGAAIYAGGYVHVFDDAPEEHGTILRAHSVLCRTRA